MSLAIVNKRQYIREEITKRKYRDPMDNFEILEETESSYKVKINWEKDVYEELEIKVL